MNINNMKNQILSVITLGLVVCTNAEAQSTKVVKAMNNTKETIAKVIQLDPIDVLGFVEQKSEQVLSTYANNEVQDVIEVQAVDTTRSTDTTEIRVGNTRIVVVGEPKIEKIYMEKDSMGDGDDDDDEYWHKNFGIDDEKKHHGELEFSIGYNGFLENGGTSFSTANRNFKLDNGKSYHVNLTYNHYFNIVKEYVRISGGIGLDWNNYRLSGDSILTPNAPKVAWTSDGTAYDKNKLLGRYVTAPVMLHVNTRKGKDGNSLGLSGGVEFGYLINGKNKLISNAKGKQKIKDTYNLDDFRYGYVARVSYGSVGLYGKYYPESAFKVGEGPDLNTFTVGLTFGLN
jgi:hypothetical protein